MTRIYRAMVYLVTFAVPVVIAACYGPAYRYRKGGRVLDKATGQPISKIDVSCETAAGSGAMSRTGTTGQFQIRTDDECTNLKAVDSLGPIDAGAPVDAGASADAGMPADAGAAVDGGSSGTETTERTARYLTKTVPASPGESSDQTIELERSN